MSPPPEVTITYTPVETPPPPGLAEMPLEPLEQPPGIETDAEIEAETEVLGEEVPDDHDVAGDPVDDLLGEASDHADPQDLLADSLVAYELALELWQRGELEDALFSLDHAYASMVEARVDDDPVLLRQQEDLRRLIARRVVEVYASRRTVVGDANAAIPKVMNDHVRREIASFQGPERKEFLAGYERSGLYRPMILEALRAAGLPEQLSWLPMVESWYKVRALSRARALGMWQFIASTGYRFGLRRTNWLDERMDPEKSTVAALAYLTELHEMFGDWLTAIAGYNCGESRVLRTINRQRVSYFDQFWDLYELLPRETRRYVPRFLAVLEIVENPAAHGFDDLPAPLEASGVKRVEVERSVRLADLEKTLGIAPGTLAALNPELRRGATPSGSYSLRLPESSEGEAVLAAVADLPIAVPAPAPQTGGGTHVVRSGESLSAIAGRYRMSTATLARLNGITDPNRLRVGQRLRLAGSPGSAGAGGARDGLTTYVVKPGDSLWRIASRYGTTVDRIRRDNGLRANTLRPGQRLRVNAGGGGGGGGVYVVQRGDTLGGIASSRRVSARSLADVNGLTLRSTIFPGQRLVIPQE
ncbi:MAG TPA: LysM peptidoglycan-binding domain-containing protein [Thermoanaerobaculia bacterium]|nr:LysM peptidoglycan-binding domain-containing protein [Thermoanaerobaculia bacterium]